MKKGQAHVKLVKGCPCVGSNPTASMMISINDECIKDGVLQVVALVRELLDELEEECLIDDDENDISR